MYFLQDIALTAEFGRGRDKIKRKKRRDVYLDDVNYDKNRRLWQIARGVGTLGGLTYIATRPQVSRRIDTLLKESTAIARQRAPEILGNAMAMGGLVGTGVVLGKVGDDILDTRATKRSQKAAKSFVQSYW